MNDETRELRRPPRKPNVGWLHVGSIQGEGSSSMLWGMILNMSIQDQQGIGLPVMEGPPSLEVPNRRSPTGRIVPPCRCLYRPKLVKDLPDPIQMEEVEGVKTYLIPIMSVVLWEWDPNDLR